MAMNDDGKLHSGEMTNTVIKSEDDGSKIVLIEVNSRKVKMLTGPATGQEIKDAAIKDGVAIRPNFVLQLELPNGTSKVIGDNDKVDVRENLSFTAIAPDDNS